jgi:predicted transcriptional regulator
MELSDKEKKVLEVFKDNEELTMVELNRRFPDTTFTDALQSLLAAGLVEKIFRKKK